MRPIVFARRYLQYMARMGIDIKRRQLLTLLAGAAGCWGRVPRAQSRGQMPVVGFLMGLADDQEARARVSAFEESFVKQGWTVGHDVEIAYRYAAGDANEMRSLAGELVELRPNVIVGHSTPVVTELFQATRTIPIVFVVVADPIGSGFAASIARPGGNVTGFTNLSPTIPGKLLTILKQIVPGLGRVELLYNPDTVARGVLAGEYLQSLSAAASAFSVEATRAEVHSSAEIEQSMKELAQAPSAGLVVMPDNFTTIHRDEIVALAAQWRIPTIYPYRYFVEAGGLISYGVDVLDLFGRAAEYVSRILHGASPSDLPIQAPTKFELVINRKTAKTLGAVVPKILLAGADDLID
jgi:putative tryptophan/tyrosine transport system substrate-binding protein